MSTAVYFKIMENLRKSVDVRLVKPSFVIHKRFHFNLVAIHKIKTTLTLNKSAYARMCILELSKVPMH